MRYNVSLQELSQILIVHAECDCCYKRFWLPLKTAETPLHTAFPVDKYNRLLDASTGSNRKASENFLLLEFQAVRAAYAGYSENVALLYTEFSNYDATNMLLIARHPN